jgi:hypothetical protein
MDVLKTVASFYSYDATARVRPLTTEAVRGSKPTSQSEMWGTQRLFGSGLWMPGGGWVRGWKGF